MSRFVKYGVCALMAFGLALAASTASAGGKLRFGVITFGGYGGYELADLNKKVQSEIDVIDRAIGSSTDKFEIDDLGQGAAQVGGGLQAWLTAKIVVTAEYERLFAKAMNDGTILGEPYHAEYSVPADAFTLTGAYFLPSASRFRFGFGAGLGYYKTKAKIELSRNGAPIKDSDLGLGSTGTPILSRELEGHGIGFHALAATEFAAMDPVHVNVQIGYRAAKTTRLEDTATGAEYEDAGGGKVKANWSDPFARAGLVVLLGSAH